jgi:hypothetical protein
VKLGAPLVDVTECLFYPSTMQIFQGKTNIRANLEAREAHPRMKNPSIKN